MASSKKTSGYGSEHNRVLADFAGVDLRGSDSECDVSHFPYLINMYRDKEAEDPAAIETVPGYRALPKTFMEADGPCNGFFSRTVQSEAASASFSAEPVGAEALTEEQGGAEVQAEEQGGAEAQAEEQGGTEALTEEQGGAEVQAEEQGGAEVQAAINVDDSTNVKEEIFLHIGTGLYSFTHDKRDLQQVLYPVATLANSPSRAIGFGSCTYILDGRNITEIDKQGNVLALGYVNATPSYEGDIQNGAYIPLAFSDSVETEQRNLLTPYYRLAFSETIRESAGGYGLTYEVSNSVQRLCRVTGKKSGVKNIFVPSSVLIDGIRYRVSSVAADAFTSSDIESLVVAPGVGSIEGNATSEKGAFYGCTSLKTVLIHADCQIGEYAFANCTLLDTLILAENTHVSPESAFSGCDKLRYIYYGGENISSFYSFLPIAVVREKTAIGICSVGGTVMVPCDYDTYTKPVVMNGTLDLFGEAAEYGGGYVNFVKADGGYSLAALRRGSICGLRFKSANDVFEDIYAFFTVTEGELVFSDDEYNPRSYYLPIPDACMSVESLSLGGSFVGKDSDAESPGIFYEEHTSQKSFGTAVDAVTVRALPELMAGRDIEVLCKGYDGVYDKRSVPDYTSAASEYDSGALRAIRGCRTGAVYDGRLFLTGNPDLPNVVFYSELPGEHGARYFGHLNFFTHGSRNYVNTAIGVHSSFLCVFKGKPGEQAGFYMPVQEEGIRKVFYSLSGAAETDCTGEYTGFSQDSVFLSSGGLTALEGKNPQSVYVRERSALVGNKLKNASENTSVALWNGYIAVMTDGEILLADTERTVTINGSKQYEWYVISDVGNYSGQVKRYRHLSVSPVENGTRLTELFVDGKALSVLGTETACDTEVLYSQAFTDSECLQSSGLGVYYTKMVENGQEKLFVVDFKDEYTAGTFSPCSKMLPVEDVLYFVSKDGVIFCFNNDKRGKPFVYGSFYDPVEKDSIHREYYTFNGRAYRCGFSLKSDNCGYPYMSKNTVAKSLVIKSRAKSGSRFEINVRTNRNDWVHCDSVTSSCSDFSFLEFDNLSFCTSDDIFTVSAENCKRWCEKQYYIYADCFKSPFGVYYLSYLYHLAGRVLPR